MMLRGAVYTGLFILSIVLQSTLFHFLKIGGTKPDLLLVIVVMVAVLKGEKAGALLGFFYGFFEDLLVGKFIGLQALTKMTTGYLIGQFEGKIFYDNLVVPLMVTFFGTIIHSFMYLILLFLLGFVAVKPGHDFFPILMTTLYNMCIALIVYGRFYHSATRGLLRTYGR